MRQNLWQVALSAQEQIRNEGGIFLANILRAENGLPSLGAMAEINNAFAHSINPLLGTSSIDRLFLDN